MFKQIATTYFWLLRVQNVQRSTVFYAYVANNGFFSASSKKVQRSGAAEEKEETKGESKGTKGV